MSTRSRYDRILKWLDPVETQADYIKWLMCVYVCVYVFGYLCVCCVCVFACVRFSVCFSVCFFCLFSSLSFIYLSISLFVCSSARLSVRLFVLWDSRDMTKYYNIHHLESGQELTRGQTNMEQHSSIFSAYKIGINETVC